MPKVALVKCSSYEPDEVQAALNRALALLGGPAKLMAGRTNALLKPNLLAPERPEKMVSTHPSVMQAMARVALDAGIHVSMGDSPGVGHPRWVAEACGLGPVYAMGVAEANFDAISEATLPQGRVATRFPIAKGVSDADLVIDCAKLKTHVMQTFTGGVKNLFGCVVGLNKPRYHLQFPDKHVFADFLVDLYLAIQPGLTIIDAIVGMEGNGPRSGAPRFMGCLIAAEDALAADLVALELIGFHAEDVPVVAAARRRRVHPSDLSQVELVGDSLDELRVTDYKKPTTAGPSAPAILSRTMRNTLAAHPVFDPERCLGCAACQRICPPQAIRVENAKADVNLKSCIRCYCCHEACPEDAISLEVGRLGRALRRVLGAR